MDEVRRAGGRHDKAPDVLDPAVAAELAALDAALAGRTDDAGWSDLVTRVRVVPPAPRPAFRRELDGRVAAGFRREARTPSALRRRVLPALAAFACLAVVVLVVGLASRGGTSSNLSEVLSAPSGAFSAAGKQAPSVDAGSAASAGSATASSSVRAPSSTPVTPGAGVRKVERTTSLDLTTSARKLPDAADGIVRATQELGGVVASSQVDSSPSGGRASFALRLPTDRVDDALKRFGELAHVERLSQGSQDITGAFVSSQDRLSDARGERKALLATLGRSTDPRRVAALRARLRGARDRVARIEGELRGLRRRADFARIDVGLTASGASAAPDAGGAYGPGRAAHDATRVLAVLAGVALVAAAVLVPFGALAAAAAWAGSGVRRRRREGALGAG